MDQSELDAIQAERRAFFTPAWFGRLLRGALPLGDTFWIGNYGVGLALLPVGVVIFVATALIAPEAAPRALSGLFFCVGLYHLALLRAVWIAGERPPKAGIWRWIARALTLLTALAAFSMAFR